MLQVHSGVLKPTAHTHTQAFFFFFLSNSPAVYRPGWNTGGHAIFIKLIGSYNHIYLLSFNPSSVGTPFPLPWLAPVMDNALGTAPICRCICDDQSMFSAAFNAAQNTPAAPIIFYVQPPHWGATLHANVLCSVTRYESVKRRTPQRGGGGGVVYHMFAYTVMVTRYENEL